ncbi:MULTISPECIES: tRNA (adenosine(37)-N6)-threonylcarbamoyltransferase complex ATPase subunit type 1 TsaE [Asticcacaulis]|uniref:tRNA (adenosine(37)-N6)-threonylcarbamoyltransferase complex ATPase subunit type 1 TsaE n=1 Tax=Asticcacaulis TaxID=76890 RepID=UPI001AE777A3|nr:MULTISPECIES: tRNA (adenosine(37)-N6)-threonylcarbamoyltransferase complex ATPase subunit type 1 TsaE [Asticcacaulis]MBP2159854.1 tRNA threonylcarbamoyladenosine biosynthesis protein TsaE [Asticcacaulis solisilvae]MDR6800899.1 tRNA threonylcarbamoyladenosine biosynthesis protein TsaE [Asticcacaulis sp. BE141]
MQTPSDLSKIDLTQPQTLWLPDEAATTQLGALVATQLKASDVLYLHGDLGMGKSSLARGLIRALTSPDQDVPSPTFTLIQSYDAPAFEVLHLDLYRLTSPDEAYELGLDDALSHAVLVIEWPDRLGHLGFDDRLDICLELPDKTNFPEGLISGRIARLTPAGRYREEQA